MLRTAIALASLGYFLAPSPQAQQFTGIIGVFPPPDVWTESAAIFDANDDGLLDVLFVNAQGWEVPGDFEAPNADPLPPRIVLNAGITAGIPSFTDATAQFFPPGTEFHGKHAAVCDFDGDGHQDIVFATAFGDQQRFFRKDSVAVTFIDETFRLPTLVINGWYAGAGDLDDDGDLDLVFADAGPNSFSAPGGKARLLLNDGAGFFSEEPLRLGAIEKIGSQNARMVDLDGDLDLDIVVDGKSPVNQLYINDGDANFTLDTTTLPSSTAPNNFSTYEMEFADLDGDLDLDGMIMNLETGFTDGAILNQLSQTGTLTLATSVDAISGDNSQDENDFLFYDTDDDGDLDLLSPVLFPGSDKLFENLGSFGIGFLRQVPGAFTFTIDSTLDMALADFDGDGAYDAVSVNGEFGPNFINKYFRNTGPPDTHSPVIGRTRQLGTTTPIEEMQAGVPIRSWIQDAIVDDGVTWVESELHWTATKNAASTSAQVEMPYIGGYLHRGVLQPEATSVGLVGSLVEYEVHASDPMGNASVTSSFQTRVCGSESYGINNGLVLTPPPSVKPGDGFSLTMQGPELEVGIFSIGFLPTNVPFKDGAFLVDLGALAKTKLFVTDALGAASLNFQLPADPTLAELTLYFQAGTFSANQQLTLSQGIEFVICAD